MTNSPPRLARFSPIQMAGMMLMVGAALAGGGLFVFSRSVKAAERIVTVNPALFPHIGNSGQVIAVFEDVNCLHCREFQQLHMGRLIASAKGCVALTCRAACGGQGWPDPQATPATTVDHVWNACF